MDHVVAAGKAGVRHARVVVLRGERALRFAEEERELAEGDSVYFTAELLHGYRGVGTRPCPATVVTSP